MFIIGVVIFAVAAVWRQGVYRHWKAYHATICYMIMCNLLYYFLVQDRLLWEYAPNPLFDHEVSEFLITFVVFPCTVLLFLNIMTITHGRRKLFHFVKWIAIYLLVELAGAQLGVMQYRFGWGYYWSVLFVVVMFPMLLLHHARPLLAYALSVGVIGFYLLVMDIPFPPPIT